MDDFLQENVRIERTANTKTNNRFIEEEFGLNIRKDYILNEHISADIVLFNNFIYVEQIIQLAIKELVHVRLGFVRI